MYVQRLLLVMLILSAATVSGMILRSFTPGSSADVQVASVESSSAIR
jgi:hypothetical protein